MNFIFNYTLYFVFLDYRVQEQITDNVLEKCLFHFSRYFSYNVPTDQQSQQIQATNKVYHK